MQVLATTALTELPGGAFADEKEIGHQEAEGAERPLIGGDSALEAHPKLAVWREESQIALAEAMEHRLQERDTVCGLLPVDGGRDVQHELLGLQELRHLAFLQGRGL